MDAIDVKLNHQGRRRRKRENEGINRRKDTLVKKAFELGEFDGIEVALLIHKHGQYTTYRSKGYISRQPSFAEIVSRAIAYLRYAAVLIPIKQTTYPPPKNLLPEDIKKRRPKKKTRREIAKVEELGRCLDNS
jgi:hypothetical protein